MQKHVLMLTTSAFVLACSPIAANAQQSPSVPMTQQPSQQQTQQQPTGPGGLRHDGAWRHDGTRRHDGPRHDGDKEA